MVTAGISPVLVCFVPKNWHEFDWSIAQGKRKFVEIDSLKLENMIGIVPGKGPFACNRADALHDTFWGGAFQRGR